MKISASLYSNHANELDLETVKVLDKYFIDYWHIDCNDDLSVFDDINAITEISDTPIDLHIITDNAAKFYEVINKNKIARVVFQIETLENDFKLPKFENTKVGLAIQINNPQLFELIKSHSKEIDFVLLMMTTPGVSGGAFDTRHFQTIRKLVSHFPAVEWCIDGGVNHDIGYILRLYGVESIVVGSFLMKNENIAQAVLQIRSRKANSEHLVSEYMIPREELPIVPHTASAYDAISAMDKYNMGIVFCEKNGILHGVMTNADMRKKIVDKSYNDSMSVLDIINTKPKHIKNTATTSQMVDYIDSINFPILVLPITNENKQLEGAISFLNLLKEDF